MKRIYEEVLRGHFHDNRQMVFLSGPRQVGKTTTARAALPQARYFNYDNRADAALLLGGVADVAADLRLHVPANARKAVIFDELHKFRRWKQFLKGFFDVYADGHRLSVLVTGSARMDAYRRGGDSLMGRFFPYRMHPLSAAEVTSTDFAIGDILQAPKNVKASTMERLMTFGGYPEPFLKADTRFYNRWKRLRADQLFREDLRDLSRVQDLQQIRHFADLLVGRAGGLLEYASAGNEVGVSGETAKQWVRLLEAVYFCFSITPWHRNVANSLRKQPKVFLWDWSLLEDRGARRENFIASHLLKSVHWWTDNGLGEFSLHYVRDKQKREVDFLVAKDNQPFLMVEVKSGDDNLSPALAHFHAKLQPAHSFQVVFNREYSRIDPRKLTGAPFVISAADLCKVLL